MEGIHYQLTPESARVILYLVFVTFIWALASTCHFLCCGLDTAPSFVPTPPPHVRRSRRLTDPSSKTKTNIKTRPRKVSTTQNDDHDRPHPSKTSTTHNDDHEQPTRTVNVLAITRDVRSHRPSEVHRNDVNERPQPCTVPMTRNADEHSLQKSKKHTQTRPGATVAATHALLCGEYGTAALYSLSPTVGALYDFTSKKGSKSRAAMAWFW
jgi:hypothetical protein